MTARIQKYIDRGLIEPHEAHRLYLESVEGNNGPPVIFLDATFGMEESLNHNNHLIALRCAEERIHNAVFFDHDTICAPDSDPVRRPHMLPSADDFADAVGMLGISNDHFIIPYAQTMMPMAGPRAWFMFRLFGHDKIAVLNGSLQNWKAGGLPVNTDPPAPIVPTGFTAQPPNTDMLITMDQLNAAIEAGDTPILDARPPERFNGSETEPRPGIPGGHMKGARCIPAGSLIGEDGKMLSEAQLRKIFKNTGGSAYATCGSGVTATMIALARYSIGLKDTPVSDDSWTVWAQEQPEAIISDEHGIKTL